MQCFTAEQVHAPANLQLPSALGCSAAYCIAKSTLSLNAALPSSAFLVRAAAHVWRFVQDLLPAHLRLAPPPSTLGQPQRQPPAAPTLPPASALGRAWRKVPAVCTHVNVASIQPNKRQAPWACAINKAHMSSQLAQQTAAAPSACSPLLPAKVPASGTFV